MHVNTGGEPAARGGAPTRSPTLLGSCFIKTSSKTLIVTMWSLLPKLVLFFKICLEERVEVVQLFNHLTQSERRDGDGSSRESSSQTRFETRTEQEC